MPPGNSGNRNADPGWAPGAGGAVLGAFGLVGRATADQEPVEQSVWAERVAAVGALLAHVRAGRPTWPCYPTTPPCRPRTEKSPPRPEPGGGQNGGGVRCYLLMR